MRWGRGTVVACGLALAGLLAPINATALDSDLKHAFAFKVEASNGYSILAFAANERADGRGEIVLIVSRKHESALYAAPAQLTATSVAADLGALGKVALEVTPSGRERKLRTRCGERETVSYEPQRFRGSFEFHGEEGYADAITTAPRDFTRFLVAPFCSEGSTLEVGGDDVPGAKLGLHFRQGPIRLTVRARKNQPSARTGLEVEVHEERGEIAISRSTMLWAGAAAFSYDPLLRTATLAPPAPFAGHASFHRNAAPANQWVGDLTVDLPGRSNVPLTHPTPRIFLTPACRQERRSHC